MLYESFISNSLSALVAFVTVLLPVSYSHCALALYASAGHRSTHQGYLGETAFILKRCLREGIPVREPLPVEKWVTQNLVSH